MTQVMTNQALREWLAALIPQQTTLAPVRIGNVVRFKPVTSVDEIAFDYSQSVVSPKEWFFPRSETLFAIEKEGDSVSLTLPDAPGPRVMFGIRPCDAKALTIIDRPFLLEPADALYQQRREKTVLVGLACAKQQLPECFCTSIGSGPQDGANVDVMLTQNGDEYIVEALTVKGKDLLVGAQLREGGVKPEPPAISNEVPTSGLSDRVRNFFNDAYWRRMADRCIGCKICTYLCPTCHCFDVRDCKVEGRTERVRCWDGCQSALFTRLAGGHNPRGSKAARLRQFYAHKFLYFPERFGVTQCVGCGRCAHFCPVNIDIRETLSDLQRLEA